MNNELIIAEINRLSNEIDSLKSTINFPIDTEIAVKSRIFSPAVTPTSYLQTLNLTGNAQSIQVPATPDIWVRLNTPVGIFKIAGYKS